MPRPTPPTQPRSLTPFNVTGGALPLQWSTAIAVYSLWPGEVAMNLSFHAWLYESAVGDSGGDTAAWPLVGVYDCVGLAPPPSDPVEAADLVLHDRLWPVDQHVHKEEPAPGWVAWHIGSDVARARIDPSAADGGAFCTAVCVDHKRGRARADLVLLLPPGGARVVSGADWANVDGDFLPPLRTGAQAAAKLRGLALGCEANGWPVLAAKAAELAELVSTA